MTRKSDLYYKCEALERSLEAEKIINKDLLRLLAETKQQLEKERENKRELLIDYDQWLDKGVHRCINAALVDTFLTQNQSNDEDIVRKS